MVDVITQITIKKPIKEVAEYASDPDNAPMWYKNIKSSIWKTPGPLQAGEQIDFVAHFLGKKLAYTYQILEYIPQERLVMATREGPFPMQTTYTWTTTEQGHTLMTLRNTGYPTGFSKLVAPFMSIMMRRANKQDLKCLKGILEIEQG